MLESSRRVLRDDCRRSFATVPDLASRLFGQRLAIVGGTGFVGCWLAEAVAFVNDEFDGRIRIDLLGRSAATTTQQYPHLRRPDIRFSALDVRSPFELPNDTTRVLFAAGVNDPKVHASDPHRVFQTTVYGIDNALIAAARLERIERFVNLSSGLVLGNDLPPRPLTEVDTGPLEFSRFHNVYAEARRAAESLANAYAGQYRIPVSTARAFTFIGPYQAPDAPWAVNNFIRDALAGHDIRIYGNGETRRSYLYGSDVAVWLLKLLVDATDYGIYNLGGSEAVSHRRAAELVAAQSASKPKIVQKAQPQDGGRHHDFLPDTTRIQRDLNVRTTVELPEAIARTMNWHAERAGLPAQTRLST